MIARQTLLIVLNNVLGGAFGLVSFFFIGHYMGPEALGNLGFALGVMGVFHVIATFGFDQAHVKRLSEGQPVDTAMGTYAGIKLTLAAAFLVIGFGSAFVWYWFKGFTDTTIEIVIVVTVYYTLVVMRHIPLQTFSGLRLAVRVQVLALVENVVRALAIVSAAVLFAHWIGVEMPPFVQSLAALIPAPSDLSPRMAGLMLAFCWAGAMGVSLAVGLWMLRRYGFTFASFDRALARRYVAFALPIGALTVFQILVSEMDKIMVGYFWGAGDVGYYVAAQRFSSLIYMVPAAAVTLVFPFLSQLNASHGVQAVSRAAANAQRYISLAIFWAALLPLAFADRLINILVGGSFVPAAPVLQALTLAAILASFTMVTGSIIEGLDRPGVSAGIAGAGIATNLALNTLLIPDSLLGVPMAGLGPLGAAIGTIGAQVVGLWLLLLATRRLTGRLHVGWSITRHVLAAGLTILLLRWAAMPLLGGVDRWYELGAAGVLGTVVYAALLVAVREVRRRDWELLGEVIHPGKLAGYVRDELSQNPSGPDQPPGKA